MFNRVFLISWCLCLGLGALLAKNPKPNVIIIYADDIGYGDLSCYHPSNRVKTPNIDQLAAQSLRFTKAYCSSATCTPSRYSLLTGEYAWRKSGTGVLPGDASAVIRSGRQTLGTLFKSAGYQTAVVGKWHLGLGNDQGADWNGRIAETPQDIGFDYSFIMAATGDRVPTVYVENSRVVNHDPQDPIRVDYKQKIGNEPTGRENPELLKMKLTHGHDFTIVNGISRIGYLSGGRSARWVDEDMADTFTQKAVQFIEKSRSQPFFMYFATHDIHVPRVPHPRFVGKSGMGPRGDALLEFDWSVGEIMAALKKNGLDKNTIVILSSDNGPVIDDGYADQAEALLNGHQPAGPLRGGKYSIFEGGTRVPFLLHYPVQVKPGVSAALVGQVDLLASFAALLGQKIDAKQAPDSQNQWAAMLGKDPKGRQNLILYAQLASMKAIADGRWKYIMPSNAAPYLQHTKTESGANPKAQLYDLKNDLGERNNVADKYPKQVQRLSQLLASQL
jgi:arylsulfatase A-like enzyme